MEEQLKLIYDLVAATATKKKKTDSRCKKQIVELFWIRSRFSQ